MSHLLEITLELKTDLTDGFERLEQKAEIIWSDLRLLGSLYLARLIVWRELRKVRRTMPANRN